jgi:hypothetical protein
MILSSKIYIKKKKILCKHNKCNDSMSCIILFQLRVSAVMSNSPYILVLDCDMFCNDPTSARYAMCFHLDPKISSSLAFVQFPQKFHNISKNDIYDSQLRSLFTVQWQGMDGLKGPVMSGTCFYIKRVSLYGNRANEGIEQKVSCKTLDWLILTLIYEYSHCVMM